MTQKEKDVLLAQIAKIKEGISDKTEKINPLLSELDDLQIALKNTSISPVFFFAPDEAYRKPEEAELPFDKAQDGHKGYIRADNCLNTKETQTSTEVKLKGFYLDVKKLELFFENNANKAAQYFLMFSMKPDRPPGKPITFGNPYFTLLILGIDQNKNLLKKGNEPIVYEYLTPHTIPPNVNSGSYIEEIDTKFPKPEIQTGPKPEPGGKSEKSA